MEHDITIKMIQTPDYMIELAETHDNKYVIRHENKELGNVVTSKGIADLDIAMRIFDFKLQELQGH